RVVKLAGHFHGWHDQVSFGTDAPFRGPDTAGVPDALSEVVTVVPADAQALAETPEGGDVAGVILEPSGAAWGTVPLAAGLLATARTLTRATGTVLVFDEVVSGFRWSPGGVQAVAGVTPDLTVLGKILAGGMPGGAVAGRADLMEHLSGADGDPRRVGHPGTPRPGRSPGRPPRPPRPRRRRGRRAARVPPGRAAGAGGRARRRPARRADIGACRGGRAGAHIRRKLDLPPAHRPRRGAGQGQPA